MVVDFLINRGEGVRRALSLLFGESDCKPSLYPEQSYTLRAIKHGFRSVQLTGQIYNPCKAFVKHWWGHPCVISQFVGWSPCFVRWLRRVAHQHQQVLTHNRDDHPVSVISVISVIFSIGTLGMNNLKLIIIIYIIYNKILFTYINQESSSK